MNIPAYGWIRSKGMFNLKVNLPLYLNKIIGTMKKTPSKIAGA